MATTIQIKRGTGSAVPTGLADGELAINLDNGKLFFGSGSTSINSFRFENLTAENYIVSSSVTNITTQELSGSTTFGDTSNDTHTFTGIITASSNISASGNLLGGGITINGNSTFNSNIIDLGVDGGDRINVNAFIATDLRVSGPITASNNISSSGTVTANSFTGNGLSINGPSNAHIEVGEYPVGFDTLGLNTLFITGSGLIVSGAMADTNHHNMLKIGDVELLDVNTAVTKNQFLIHNVRSFAITSGSDVGSIVAGTGNTLLLHNGHSFFICKDGESTAEATIHSSGTTTKISDTTVQIDANVCSIKAPNSTPPYIMGFDSNPNSTPQIIKSIEAANIFPALGGAITASAVSASGNIIGASASFGQIYDVNDDGDTLIDFPGSNNVDLYSAGRKQINVQFSSIRINDSGNDVDVFIEGDSDANLFRTDASTDRVGIGVATPTSKLDVAGNIKTNSHITASGDISSSGQLTANNALFGTDGIEISSGKRVSYVAPNIKVRDTGLHVAGGPITASGNISSSGDIAGNTITVAGTDFINLHSTGYRVNSGAGPLNLFGNITASGDISSSGTITAATLDAAAVSDTLAAAIVAEIDNDEIPIAKLAEDSISGVALGSNLNNLTVDNATLQLNSGTTYNGSAARTISIKDGGVDSDALADDITVAGTLSVATEIQHSGDADTKIAFSTDVLSMKAGNTEVFGSTSTGSLLPNVHQNIYDTGSVALVANSAFGDIVKFGGGSTVAGGIYQLQPNGTWALALANAAATSTGSLAVAVGTNPTTDGMCLRGFINPFLDPEAGIGSPVYLSDTNTGRLLAVPPSSTNDVVRIVGYQYGTDLIYFNPSNDFIIHA